MDICVIPPHHNTGLPSIGLFEASKFKSDEMEHSRRESSSTTSPTSYRFPGPLNTSQSSQAPSVAALISPPTSRRTSSEEQAPPAPARQSLPSIHEALGRDSSLNYSGLPPPPPPPASSLPATTAPFMHPPTSTTAPDPPRRLFAPPESAPLRPSGPTQSPPIPQRHAPAPSLQHSPTTPYPSQGPLSYASQAKPPSSIRSDASPPTASSRPPLTYPSPQHSASSFESGPHPASGNPPYGYSGYQSQYQYPPASSSSQSYPAPAVVSAPPQYPAPPSYRDYPSGNVKPQINHRDTVKRKLDEFELDRTIYEMKGVGADLQSFADQCQRRVFEVQSSGAYHSVANVHDIDRLIDRLRSMQEYLGQFRDVVAQPNDAMVHDDKGSISVSNGYMRHDGGYADEPQQTSMYPPQDTKKRRGRAAPPGRCHSCNRHETPEWRRGPDGARTLCNACGLHYAKLTRKNNNKQSISNSNIRPKSIGPPGPPPPGVM